MAPLLAEILIPSVVFGLIAWSYSYQICRGVYSAELPAKGSIAMFTAIRHAWIDHNHLSGQTACNTTRDYLRVLVFLSGNTILIASVLTAFALNVDANESFYETFLLVKLGCCVVIFVAIFILLLLSMRYILHFRYILLKNLSKHISLVRSFLINVKEINGKLTTKAALYSLFDYGHSFYAAGSYCYLIINQTLRSILTSDKAILLGISFVCLDIFSVGTCDCRNHICIIS
jgi:hypothetical protein